MGELTPIDPDEIFGSTDTNSRDQQTSFAVLLAHVLS